MNESQRIVAVRDQFALKNASDETLRQILPSYRQAIDRIKMQLDFLPEGKIERELWLKTQLRTIEQQFQQVADRIDQVLPAKQAEQFYKSMDNAREYMQADIESLPTDGPLNVVRTDQVPAGEFTLT